MLKPAHAFAWLAIRSRSHYRSGTSPLSGGMGSPARLLALAYRPALVPVVFGIDAPSVSGREISPTPNRTVFFAHDSLRVCPSLLSQSDQAFLTSRLEHRYAADFRSAKVFGATRSKSSERRYRAAATVASGFLLVDRSTPTFCSSGTISLTCIARSALCKIGLAFSAREFLRVLFLGWNEFGSEINFGILCE